MNIRFYSLVRYLQQEGGISIDDLEKKLCVSRATVYRYLSMLQEMNFPLTNEIRNRKSYYFFDMSNPIIGRNVFENLPYLKSDFFFDKDEKMLIEYIFSNTEVTVPTLKKDLQELHEKMKILLSFAGHVSDSVDGITSNAEGNIIKHTVVRKIASFNDMPKKSEKNKLLILSTLCDAVAQKRVCVVTYKAVNKDDSKTYRFMPLVVFSYQGGFYTIGETDKYDYTCKLAIERIEEIEMLDETFKRKTDIDIPWIMTDPFGLAQGDQFEAQIQIPKDSIQRIKDRDWPSKRVKFSEPAEDGSIIMTVITSGEFELIRWLRYMGTEARLIKPDWIVEKLKTSIHNLAEIYK